MSVRFDAPARRAIERAMIEAETRHHATLDTGHILLGVLAPADGAAAAALTHLGVSADVVREATSRLLDAEFAAGSLAIEISPATDDLLLRAYQHSLARESPTVSDVDILIACAMDAATTAGMALQDVGVTVDRLAAVTPLPVARPAPDANHIEKLGSAIDTLLATNLLMFKPSCWKRATVLHRYLALRGISTSIVFGVMKDAAGELKGHAWLERDDRPRHGAWRTRRRE